MRLLWRALVLILLALAVLGVFVPVLPSVPFVLAAAWAAGHGWPALERWLLNHPRFGEPIRRWREHGAVPRRAKWVASAMMLASAALLVVAPGVPDFAKIGVPMLMSVVVFWLWRRPER